MHSRLHKSTRLSLVLCHASWSVPIFSVGGLKSIAITVGLLFILIFISTNLASVTGLGCRSSHTPVLVEVEVDVNPFVGVDVFHPSSLRYTRVHPKIRSFFLTLFAFSSS